MTIDRTLMAATLMLAAALPSAQAQGTANPAFEAKPVSSAVVGPVKKTYSFTILPGKNSPAIVPPAGIPVSVSAVQLTLGTRGVASATLLRISGQFLEWTGLSSPFNAAIENGFGGSAGTHILYVDFPHQVDLQVAGTDSFVVHNGAGYTATVKITLTY